MTRRIVFHVGLAKTGTTSFQRFCHENRRLLRRHGVLYPRAQCGRQHNHSPLVASYIAHRPEDFSVAMRWTERTEAIRRLEREIEASTAHTVLLSSEHFSTHFDRTEALRLAQDFAAYDTTVVIVLRDTHARFMSSYNTHVTAGGALTPLEFAHGILQPGTRWMRARETVEIWEEAFGRERLVLVDYDAYADVTAPILACCGADIAPALQPRRDRASLSPDVIERLRRANAAIRRRQRPGADRKLWGWLRLSLLSLCCRKYLTLVTPDGTGGWRLHVATVAALDAIAAADRLWLAEHYGIVLRGAAARAAILTDE